MELLKNLEGLSADEQMTAVVELQKAAMKHLDEQKQASIGKSAELVIQGLKKIKSDFEAKFDSLNYDIQTKVANLKDGEQGLQGPKGDQGERGLDGANGRDGRDGKDGKDGVDGVDGVGVRDAKIDFDGSLVISLTDGREINCGEVVSVDVAKQIQKVTHNIQTGAGGDSQTVLDAIAAIQATIATYGTMATQNKTSVDIEGGTIDNTTIGATTPSTGVFTTLTATGQTSLGGGAGSESFRAVTQVGQNSYIEAKGGIYGTNSPQLVSRPPSAGSGFNIANGNAGAVSFYTNDVTSASLQARISHTASAVNYVQVTGAATGVGPTLSTQGSDANTTLNVIAKGSGLINLGANGNPYVLQVQGTASGANYNSWRVAGGAGGSGASSAPVFSTWGIDTNISAVFQSKGTGAIDLAAGSSGVNISNGGTVTAITRTASGSGYTSFPSVAISAPTTAGGVQAVVTIAQMQIAGATIQAGGTGYTVGDTLTIVGGTPVTSAATLTVATVSGGVITGVNIGAFTNYTALPTNPVSVTGGTGSGATFNINYAVISFTITNAGSGYVEQPTVTFSGGGGSGAAAYATVGSPTIVRTIGASLSFHSPQGEVLRLNGSPATNLLTDYLQIDGGVSGVTNGVYLRPGGSSTNQSIYVQSKGTGTIGFFTNWTAGGSLQLNVAHTASAVNYVQVTGAATSGLPVISAQGSDTNIAMYVTSKGNGTIRFATNNSAQTQLRVSHTTSAVNFVDVTGSAAGASPIISVVGNDTNIDLALTPKGTGNVRFGTYTASMALTVQGYIEIKDAGGTVRKLAVIA